MNLFVLIQIVKNIYWFYLSLLQNYESIICKNNKKKEKKEKKEKNNIIIILYVYIYI